MERHEFTVDPDSAGLRLDVYLAGLLPLQSRSQLQRLIKEGAVVLAGRPTKPNTSVKPGDIVTIEIPDAAPATPVAQELPLPAVYQDEDVIVVDKPAGMVVHPAAGHAEGTLVNALLFHADNLSGVGGEQRPGIVHRLDRGTSGLMVVAKNDLAHRELTRQFHDREVEKEYIALAWGEVHAGRRIDLPVGRDPVHREKMSTRARRARTAVTRVTKSVNLRGLCLLHVAIATGRTHQIRVHLSAIGHPIVGDSTYGGVRHRMPAPLRAVERLERPFLHAARLVFTHPTDGRRMEFTCPLPPDLQGVLDELEARVGETRDHWGL
ncbi:MAG TPA: RluA family pseudouridine synthase [Vicinamibacterales bacterium]|jgi:23S rRNA pseudouridine1911/1915/1917 synthase